MEATDGFGVLHDQKRLRIGAQGSAMSGLAATLREAQPGTMVRLELKDGREVAGAIRGVNGESVSLEGSKKGIELRKVRRVILEFSSAPSRKRQHKRAA
jgi:hypothetical protein